MPERREDKLDALEGQLDAIESAYDAASAEVLGFLAECQAQGDRTGGLSLVERGMAVLATTNLALLSLKASTVIDNLQTKIEEAGGDPE